MEITTTNTSINAMERLYIKDIFSSPTYTVYHRPTHSYITSITKDAEGEAELKRLLSLPVEEFYSYLILKGCSLPNSALGLIAKPEAEEFYKKAWASQTERVLSSLGITQEVEEIPFDFIMQAQKKEQTLFASM